MSVRPPKSIFLMGASAAIYVILLAYFLAEPYPTRLDLAADDLLRASDARDPWGDEVEELAVDYILMGLIDGGLVLAAWRYGSVDSGLLVMGTIAVQEVVIRATKTIVARPRPEDAFSVTGAYPSGHVANLAIAVLLFFLIVLPLVRRRNGKIARLPRETGFAGAIIATFAIYRVFAGEHWITDVIGAVALALMFALAAERVHRTVRTEKP